MFPTQKVLVFLKLGNTFNKTIPIKFVPFQVVEAGGVRFIYPHSLQLILGLPS